MKIAQYIHYRWRHDATLSALLPPAQVATGIYFPSDPGSVYGTITLPGGAPSSRTNDGLVVAVVTVRVQVHHDNYDSGLTIARAVADAFDRSDFWMHSTSSSSSSGETGAGCDKVICCQLAGPWEELQDDDTGEWDFVMDFDCRVSLEDGY